jgi:hypothetical protein
MKLEEVIKAFETANKTDKENPGQVLRDLIETSPALKKQLEDAVAKGELTAFKALPPGTHAGGQYSGTTMEIPIERLNKAATDKATANEMVFVLGHETRHGLNNPAEKKALEAFDTAVKDIAKSKSATHDYTKPVGDRIQHYRENEASAHLSGWNALASKLTKEKGAAPTLQDMYDANPGRMQDFIDRTGKAPKYEYALKAGLTAGKDMQMDLDAGNIKAMGDYYFDKPLSKGKLGANGNQNYPNYYGDAALNRVAQWEKTYNDHNTKLDPKHKPPTVEVDLAKLGLSKTVLTTGLGYTDTSAKKPIESKPEVEHGTSSRNESTRSEHPLYGQALKALQGVQGQIGLTDGAELRNAAAATAALAQKAGMEQIDGALVGKDGKIFAYQGNPTSEHADRIAVDLGKAKQQPAAESLAAMTPDMPQAVAQQPARSQSM